MNVVGRDIKRDPTDYLLGQVLRSNDLGAVHIVFEKHRRQIQHIAYTEAIYISRATTGRGWTAAFGFRLPYVRYANHS
nr:hypothetical protein CFP56_04242 [Quercus suber]